MPTKPTHLPELLITRRSALRRHSIDLAPLLYEIVIDERERLGSFVSWVHQLQSLEDERIYLKNSLRDWQECRTFDFGIYSTDSNQFMGCIGAHTLRWEHDCCEIGFWISKQFEGQGIIGDALRGIEDALFSVGFHRIEIRCDLRNTRSAKVAERAGYQLDGTLRQNLCERGNYRDTMVWSKLRNF